MAYTGISIVIPAYNEGKYITATLEAAQTSCVEFTKAYGLHAEILVVNNASTDDTETVVRQLNARVVNHSLRNISSVRNAGIREARHDLIVTIDADSFLPRDALIKIWERMLDSGCVGGCLGVRRAHAKFWHEDWRICCAAFGGASFGNIRGHVFLFANGGSSDRRVPRNPSRGRRLGLCHCNESLRKENGNKICSAKISRGHYARSKKSKF